ncbi:DsbE family thiol:disulfide interchange protein [Hyphomicrobium sp. LHD-15]|uniref:DsbE family thiol:disulfide interchange protein n=1 Tax=Hyphomicrobium sp. LHD-15 TaxID=3072142 RepID=UPI00280CCFD2|nr:DsbE family thiol:disulfide interchange protein [Hyphomicrobium sp. LHD-15]MDQ8698526.1 DsbE family thiol:disulfide interchange protein [Hyphomicrobium sp. LHD-15]
MTLDPNASGAATASASKRRGWVAVPLALFLLMVGLFAFGLTGDPTKLPSALIGRAVPQTDFPALEGLISNGQPAPGFHAADLAKGRVSVVNFWASWCAPCIEEHPLLIALKERTGVDIYGVNYKDQAEAGRRFLGRYGNPFTAVGTDQAGRNAIEWGVYGMPETFVINGEGKIAYKHVGPISEESLERQLMPAIEKARGGSKP